MIKIIKHGYTRRKIKCRECGCEFFFSDADAYRKADRKYYVDCPECLVPLNTKNATKGV